MVDVGGKAVTRREAIARGRVILGKTAFDLVSSNQMKKGDVLGVAKVAGIQAAKQTGLVIPLCHPLLLTKISVDLTLNPETQSVEIEAAVGCDGKTGVEMEALHAVSIAACTVYDMCKAINKEIVISDIRLVKKTSVAI